MWLEGRSVKRIPPQPTFTFDLDFQKKLITSSPVAKGMTDEAWWQSNLNWRQKVVHKHTYISIYAGENITSHHVRRGGNYADAELAILDSLRLTRCRFLLTDSIRSSLVYETFGQ